MAEVMTWKELYTLERYQLAGEGYAVDDFSQENDANTGNHLLQGKDEAHDDAAQWKAAYMAMRARMADGIKSGCQYNEPNEIESIFAGAEMPPKLLKPDADEYADKVKGAWLGRCAGVILGKPLEMGMDRLKIKEYLESVDAYPLSEYVPARSEKLNLDLRKDCIPSTRGNIKYVQSDDDVHYTICSLLLAEEHGENFTRIDAAQNLLDNITYNWVWTADKHLYHNLVNLDQNIDMSTQLEGIADDVNPWRESMCPQLKSDLWGYITPADTRRGAKMIHRLGSLSATKNGLYGGMFMQGCVSAAMSAQPTVDIILDAGLSNIPTHSRLHEAICRVRTWYTQSHDWIQVCDRIYSEYGHWYFAGAINNLCFITLALLEGNLDFEKTICTAVMCGTDTDCNSGNAGSVVGAALGANAMPKKWTAPFGDEVHSCVAGFGYGTLSDLINRTIKVHDAINTSSDLLR